MTMKNRKTLAAVAVLLVLALVFAAPVSAEEEVTEANAVAKIVSGETTTYYATLQAAVDAATGTPEAPTTITLLGTAGSEVTGDGVVVDKKHIIIDFSSFTYNVTGALVGSEKTETQGFQLLRDSTVTLKNGKITSTKAKFLVQNYANLTLESIELDGTQLITDGGKYVLSNNYGNIKIGSGTVITAASDGVAFDVYDYSSGGYTPGPVVTVESGATINGKIEVSSTNNCQLIVNGGTFTDPTVLNYLGSEATTETVTVKLAENHNLNEKIILSQGSATLDLNGKTLDFTNGATTSCIKLDGDSLVITSETTGGKVVGDTFAIWVAHGKLVVSNDVEVVGETYGGYSAIYIVGSSENVDDVYSEVDIQSGSKVTGAGWAASVNIPTNGNAAYGVKLTVAGELSGGITINGQVKPVTGKVPEIAITESAKITATSGSAIYAAGYGIWTIAEGAEITGNESLSIKSGKFTVNGGTFTANGEYVASPIANNNGPVDTGAALSITSSDNYVGNIEVTVSGGTFTSEKGHAVYEGIAKTSADSTELEATESKVNSISITGGSFTSAVDDVVRIDEATEKIVVSGGTFNKEVKADYLADNYHNKQVEDDYKVTNEWTVTFNSNGGSTVDPVLVVNNTKVTQPTNPTKTNYKFDGWFTDEGCTTAFDFDAPVTADITLNAKWTENKQTNTGSSSSGSSSSNSKPADTPVEPETPAEPEAGEPTVETEVTDGGEVALETTSAGGSAAAADEEEAKVTGVVLPTGTEGKVTFIPISEQPAPAGKETQTKKVFEINIPNYEKGKAAVIKFQMTVAELEADGKTAAEVSLWHFDEETGEWTKLVTSYIIIDGVVYFEAITNDFSPFAIVYEDAPVDEPQDEPETPATPAPLAAVLAGLGAAVVLRRK